MFLHAVACVVQYVALTSRSGLLIVLLNATLCTIFSHMSLFKMFV